MKSFLNILSVFVLIFVSFWTVFALETSDRWFSLIENIKLEKIKENSYINWNKDAQITWLVYSDLECPYCAKLHNNWTAKVVKAKYGDKVNIIFNHFPLAFHKNAFPASQILECSAEQEGSSIFYALINKSFENKNSNYNFMLEEAIKLWVNKEKLNICIKDKRYDQKIKDQTSYWTETFWVRWTPWSIIINNTTLEYDIISWVYPTDNFIKVIDSLLLIDDTIKKLRIKYNNNSKVIKVFNNIESIISKLNLKQLNYLSDKISKLEQKLKNKKDSKSLLMKDIILYIVLYMNEYIDIYKSEILSNN
jgi:protein-disulfide isomerase